MTNETTTELNRHYKPCGENADWIDEAWLVHEHGYAVVTLDDYDEFHFVAYVEHDDLAQGKAYIFVDIDADDVMPVLAELDRYEWRHAELEQYSDNTLAIECAAAVSAAIVCAEQMSRQPGEALSLVAAHGFEG